MWQWHRHHAPGLLSNLSSVVSCRGRRKGGSMTKNTLRPVKKIIIGKTISWTLVLIVILVIILLPAGGFAFAANLESQDKFCGSCHTQPESTYLQRSNAAQPADLASYHTTQSIRCIDCHSGRGLGGRLQAEILGARNTIKWYSGTAVQPAPLTHPINDRNCLKCHQQITERGYTYKNKTLSTIGEAQNGHWHQFLTRWQAQASTAGTCVSCHGSHSTDGDLQILYLNEQHTTTVCESCHQTLGGD
jgi:predicted CXXCH cytochrome family protein